MTVTMSVNDLRRRRLLRIISLVIAVITAVSVTTYAKVDIVAAPETKTESLDELQSQYDKLEEEMSENQEKLDQVQEDIDAKEEVVDDLGDEIDDTQAQVNLLLKQQKYLNDEIKNAEQQINVITAQLNSLSEQIASTENYILEKQALLDATYDLLKMRIRAMYMAGNGSALEFLLTSEDFSTLLTRAELLIRVAKHDNELMNTLSSDIEVLAQLEEQLTADIATQEKKRDELDAKTKSLEKNKADIEENSKLLAEKQAELEADMKQAEKELATLDKESDEYKAIISKQEDELIALSKQIEDFIKSTGSSTTDKPSDKPSDDSDPVDNPYMDEGTQVFASGMIFPLKCSGVYISSPYGMRTHPTTGEYKLHTGTDFTAGGINGKTVYAVKDGEVIYAAKHKAYGNFVIIDHGNGISSCYAHMQDGSMTVSVGDKVLQGQPIGKVGSTGYSTGPHLHFEIRIDGTTTNPMNGYIELPG